MADARYLDKLIEEYKRGKKSVFNMIYELTYRPIYYAVYYILREKASSEDILQDTYLTALNKLDMYKIGTNFQGWLVQIGKNLAINHLKRSQREIPYDFDKNPSLIGQYTMEEGNYNIIGIAKKILSEDEFSIVMLISVEGYKRRELADMYNIPISTVTWKYQQSLDKLKKEIEKMENRE